MAKRYYWLKLKEDFFRQRQIKKLRKIAGGDTFTIIYLKMLLLAMKDDGRIALDGLDFSEELALELDEEAENVKMTVSFLLHSGLMEEVNGNEMFVPAAIENVGSESSSAERVRKFRARQNVLEHSSLPLLTSSDDEKMVNKTEALQCNADVTTEIEIRDRDKRIEKEKEERDKIRDKKKEADASVMPNGITCPYSEITNLFNSICKSLTPVSRLTDGRRKAIAARWKELKSLEAFKKLFEIAEASAFLTGNNDRGWQATFDWLIKPTNTIKVLEGVYSDRHRESERKVLSEKRAQTQEELEEQLRQEGINLEYPDFADL